MVVENRRIGGDAGDAILRDQALQCPCCSKHATRLSSQMRWLQLRIDFSLLISVSLGSNWKDFSGHYARYGLWQRHGSATENGHPQMAVCIDRERKNSGAAATPSKPG